MDDIYENIDEYSLNKKCKTSIVLDDMIADTFIDMFRLLIRNLIVTELCQRHKTKNFSYFYYTILVCCTKRNFTIPNKQELQQIKNNHSLDTYFKHFMRPCKKYTAKPISFQVYDTTLASDNPLRFSSNLLEKMQKVVMTTDDKIRY